jgi:hypothetical protein
MPHQPNQQDQPSRPHEREATDPGAYIGHEPERSTETIPGGVGPKDERVSAIASQPGDEGTDSPPPAGHRQGDRVSDDDVREAGQNG